MNSCRIDNKISVMSKKPASRTAVLVAALITVIISVFFVHRPVLSAKAVSFDDKQFLTDYNPLVQKPGLKSAWQILTEVFNPSSITGYYQPLSIISVMLDYAAGANAKNFVPFHRTNLILHVLNTALLIVLLYIIFGQPLPAAMAGLLFGVHPLTVEPIAWITERKTLLAMFFALWCLIFYVRYVRTNSRGFYIASIAMYVFALMSKPTSLPLCAALLVMDYWPLGRISNIKYQISKLRNGINLILEKIPFFVLGGVFAVITMISNTRKDITSSIGFSFETNLQHILLMACYLVGFYLSKIVWPVNLSSIYPSPEPVALSNPKILGGIIITAIVVIILLYSAKRSRVFLGGGLFFLTVISPTLGLVRFSPWITASDKYVYMPAVGLMMILTWLLAWLWKRFSTSATRRAAVSICILVLAAGESAGLRIHLANWRDTDSYLQYMCKLTPGSAAIHNFLGATLFRLGKFDEAAYHFQESLRLNPNYYWSHINMGTILASRGDVDGAVPHFLKALEINPESDSAHYNLGLAYAAKAELEKAALHLRKSLQLKPDDPYALITLAAVLITNKDSPVYNSAEALKLAERACELTDYKNPEMLDVLSKVRKAVIHKAE